MVSPNYHVVMNHQNQTRTNGIWGHVRYILMLWSIPRLLCRPPAGFEALVGDHFRRCSGFVLRACEAYLQERCAIGTLDGEARARADGSGEPRRCSEGFRIALHSVFAAARPGTHRVQRRRVRAVRDISCKHVARVYSIAQYRMSYYS
jgi:hypothetical protein